ncbi:hypothetical protein O6H91_07G012400 [Diphasiastrum complanatum]|uniref:Uncharacterized protein n=1 Tax=Diphasiastrum complanatum TaxID=34168 RepID=A0ACC2D2B9_DIPCM|nr:hypothetical protein O6H91_07G012400 [Diphasiastrum complanatum]
MCPLRLILIFLSASVAGYFAWKTLWADNDASINFTEDDKESKSPMSSRCRSYERVGSKVSGAFWMLVDMASGRYLWHTFSSQRMEQQAKSR